MRAIALVLATWRLTRLLVREDGPFDLLAKIRYIAGIRYDEYSNAYGTNVVGDALTCVWCTSVWIGAFAALFSKKKNVTEYIINALALSATTILIDETIDRITGDSP